MYHSEVMQNLVLRLSVLLYAHIPPGWLLALIACLQSLDYLLSHQQMPDCAASIAGMISVLRPELISVGCTEPNSIVEPDIVVALIRNSEAVLGTRHPAMEQD